MSSSTLASAVAKSLPKGVELRIKHLTHPPVACDPIFSPPPGEQAEITHFQSQFLAVSIRNGDKTEGNIDNGRELLVFAVEVLVYTTARLTTVFVSKADSTGCLYLLDLPPKTSSLIRNVSTAFLSYLVHVHQRPGIRLVLSLFARSQNQYLFPNSSENTNKHILDDRGLVKWWCRVFDPILRTFEPENLRQSKDIACSQQGEDEAENKDPKEATSTSATAYLIVPGCEKPETRTFFPPTFRSDDNKRSPRWANGYPLHQLSSVPTAPPRCLIPRFPDDPKARFLVDLDDEIVPEYETGQWRSVKTLDQFWEMMAFRQECSAGRLVGFLWMVVNPPGLLNSDGVDPGDVASSSTQKPTAAESQLSFSSNNMVAAQPPPSSTTIDASSSQKSEQPCEGKQDAAASSAQTPAPRAAGVDDKTLVLAHGDYTTATAFLLELDFADKEAVNTSTASWTDKLSTLLPEGSPHGETVIGEKQLEDPASQSSTTAPSNMNMLDGGLIRKRKRAKAPQNPTAGSESEDVGSNRTTASGSGTSPDADRSTPLSEQVTANVLPAHLTRKKKKT